MKHRFFAAAVLALAAASASAESDLASLLPEDIPGGREGAAKCLASGVPQLVKKALEDLAFAQEPPVFEPWRVALSGKASAAAREPWIIYLLYLMDRDVEAKPFREEAAAWFEAQKDMPPIELARLTSMLHASSETLAKRLEDEARGGDLNALLSLAGNPAAHPLLLEMCKEPDVPEPRRIVTAMGASYAQSVAFRPLYEEWLKSEVQQVHLIGVNGILRLGDPADIQVARDYLKDRRTLRRFEVYRSLSFIKSKDVVDLLLKEQPRTEEMNREAVLMALMRQDDERILPRARELRDQEGYTRGACRLLWRFGKAGDIPWLASKMDDEPEAALAVRRLLGKDCPIAYAERAEGVAKWIEAHKDAIAKDEELPKK